MMKRPWDVARAMATTLRRRPLLAAGRVRLLLVMVGLVALGTGGVSDEGDDGDGFWETSGAIYRILGRLRTHNTEEGIGQRSVTVGAVEHA